MKMLVTFILLGSAALAGHLVTVDTRTTDAETIAAESPKTEAAVAPSVSPKGLVLHEWGTFTSFSGSNGVPVGFQTNNSDLPQFVYHHSGDVESKWGLQRFGTVSMETPVIYFYTDKEVQSSIRVDFPKGWITEWYPHATAAPDEDTLFPNRKKFKFFGPKEAGEAIQWDIKLTPGEQAHFPQEKGENPYYHARETDAAPLQTSFDLPDRQFTEPFRGGGVTQREKFLFYRGVGTFSPPVTVQAIGGGKVRVVNAAGGRVTGMVLLVVRDGQIHFKALDSLEAGSETVATLPETTNSSTELGLVIEKGLIAAGLYEREAQAMVKTWDHAWFREEGARILYILPRTRTDELLPLSVTPQPSESVRVIVGRHDFLTPEQETVADAEVARIQKARAELAEAEAEMAKLGRFSQQAKQLAGERFEAKKK
jgi:hypothetical protein